MPGIIALALIAIVALTVLSFTAHLLFSPWPPRSSASWPGSVCRAAPTSSTPLRPRYPMPQAIRATARRIEARPRPRRSGTRSVIRNVTVRWLPRPYV